MSINRRNIMPAFLTACLVILTLLAGCADAPFSPKQTPPEQPSKEGVKLPVNLPPMPQPDKGNPKLDSFLNQLVDAEKRGEAEAFARQRNVKLVDGKVRVQIESEPGQIDAAAKAALAVGKVELISPDINHVQAVVPINSLIALAAEESIRIIGMSPPPVAGN